MAKSTCRFENNQNQAPVFVTAYDLCFFKSDFSGQVHIDIGTNQPHCPRFSYDCHIFIFNSER